MEISIPEVDAEAGAGLVDEAHAMCPYSRATRRNITVSLELADD